MLTRMNSIYEREMAMRFVLIDDNDKLIFLNASTDPYTTGGGKDILGSNTGIINPRITGGASAYDVGHVLHICTDIGGVAQGGSACQSNKGNGVTCNNDNDLSGIVTRVMAHEVGHQFDASHTWNICLPDDPSVDAQRAGNWAYEPGSGTTIMSYAGTCGSDNVASDNDDYFHVGSLVQMYAKTYSGGNAFNCSDKVPTTNNFPEITINKTRFTIPISTPFELKGSATDENGDALTYCWEQYDLGPKEALGTNGSQGPLFRSFKPAANGNIRFFPKAANILSGNFSDKTEVLPNVSRELTFRLTVRDNNAQASGVVWDELKMNVTSAAGPFKITFPEVDASFKTGQLVSVTWDVANTDKAPVNCKSVNIFGSFSAAIREGDANLVPLALGVPNDGSQDVTIPNRTSNFFRIIIKAADNVFLTSSRIPSRITEATNPAIFVVASDNNIKICQPDLGKVTFTTQGLGGFTGDVQFRISSGLPAGITASLTADKVKAGETSDLLINTDNVVGNINGQVIVKAFADDLDTVTSIINFSVEGGNINNVNTIAPANGAESVSGLPSFNWNRKPDAVNYEIQVASNPSFLAGNIVAQKLQADSSFVMPVLLDKSTIYYWRVRANNNCKSGTWSEVKAFITEALACKVYESGTQNIVISTAANVSVEIPVNINDSGTISDLNIKSIKATHGRLVDLVAFLVAPSGKEALLWSRQCSTQKDINVGLDDQSPDFFACPINTGKVYRTQISGGAQRLDIFNGESMTGTWKLRLEDKASTNGGALTNLDLEICANIAVQKPFLVNNKTLDIHPGDKLDITSALLKTQDNDNTAAELTYTLVEVPSKGQILFNGQAVGAGAQFTQQNVDNARIRYVSDAAYEGLTGFLFTVYDGKGGWIGITQFTIKADKSIPNNTNDINLNQDVYVYPNPATESINIVLTGKAEVLNKFSVLDITGKLLMFGDINDTKQTVGLQQLNNGMYMIQLTDGKQTVTKKIVKM
jgi:subtilisin-like proprotein convertase family protein